MWITLLLVVAGAVIAAIWSETLRAREFANSIAIETCRRLHVQFLDGTVAFSRLRPGRDNDGRLGLRRSYVFDYTEDGMNRRQGFVILHGRNLEAVGLAPDQRVH